MRTAAIFLCNVVLFLGAFTAPAAVVTQVTLGSFHSLLIKSDGSLWGMGYNGDGELGDGTTNNSFAPELIQAGGIAMIAGGGSNTLFVKTNGSLWGTGYNGFGQLGDGTTNDHLTAVQIVPGGVTAIAAGGSHSLFLKSGGSLWAMGYNSNGQLGDGTTNNALAPELIVASNVIALAAGFDHSLFVKTDGSLWGMGHDNFGQLGDGTSGSTNRSLVPKQIVASNVVALAAGFGHSLFVKSDGSLWGIGLNNLGQLGIGTFNNSLVPTQIVASSVTAVAAGKFHSLFISNATLFAMGDNIDGELGNGNSAARNQPGLVLFGSNVTSVAAAGFHSAFLKSDGTAWHMGDNSFGQLGNGTTIFLQVLPRQINSLFPGANPPIGGAPLLVQLKATNMDFYGNSVTNWTWDFGDGTTATNAQNPSHTYFQQAGYAPAVSGTLTNGSVVTSVTSVNVTGLVTNGGFETGNFSGWTQSGSSGGTGVITWNGTLGAVTLLFPQNFIRGGNFGCAAGPLLLGYLSQTLTTATGASYLVSCWVNADSSARGDEFQVQWNGATLLDVTNVPQVGWQDFRFLVSASGASSTVKFGFKSPSFLGFDDAGVVAVVPVAASADKTNGPFPLTVHFTSPSQDSLGNTITNWNWDFGDGTPHSSLQSPAHTYFQLGAFSPVLLGVNNSGGEIAWVGPQITVTTPTLQVNATPTNGAAPFAVQFTSPGSDSGGSAVASWNWDFGDGTSSAAQNPVHTYAIQGVSTPTLAATNSFGIPLITFGLPVIQTSGLVTNGGFESGDLTGWMIDNVGNATVVSNFSRSGNFCLDWGYQAQVSQDVATLPGAGYLISFWLYNNEGGFAGPFQTFWNGNLISSLPYTNLPYGVWTNIQGYVVASGTNSLLSFFGDPNGNLYMDDVSVTPAAVQWFTVTPATGPINLAVHFASPPTNTFGQTITSWDWDFGDGSPHSSLQNPTHTYTNVGIFPIALVATNNVGAMVPGAEGITVTASLPTVQVAATQTNGPLPLAVQFTTAASDNSGLALTTWNWTLGDGATSTVQNPQHTYYEETSTTAGPAPALNPFFQPILIGTNTAGIEVVGIVPPISVNYNPGGIVNGSFETADFTGWTATGTVTIRVGSAYSGTWGAFFSTPPATLSQTVPTTPGAAYVLTFAMASFGEINGMNASWNGTPLLSGTNWFASQDWTDLVYFVNATSSNTVLQFQLAPGTNNFGMVLDDVGLVPLAAGPAQPGITGVGLSGANLVLNITNGQAGKSYQLLTSTNLALPRALWTPLTTNALSTSGIFTITATNAVSSSTRPRFFLLRVQ